jgi:hypothetical protein
MENHIDEKLVNPRDYEYFEKVQRTRCPCGGSLGMHFNGCIYNKNQESSNTPD